MNTWDWFDVIFNLDIEPSYTLILLAYARHADKNGGSIFPSKNRIAFMTGFTRRYVRFVTHELVEMGLLEVVEKKQGRPTIYQFTERFSQAVGRLNPDTNNATLFPADGGPEDIAPAGPDGSMWFTRTTGGNIARISPTGEITATSKVVKGSEPFGITVAPNGDPWFTMLSADKIATLQLR
jgi:streptogramin lyase